MYTKHFGLNKKPFSITPNSKLLFLSNCHEKALAFLEYGLTERAGFMLLTGEAGTGKTTLVQYTLDKIASQMDTVVVTNTRFSADQIFRVILKKFGIPCDGLAKEACLDQFNQFLIDRHTQHRQVLLVIDEAQDLSTDVLEEIRMLSNFQCDDQQLIQIFMVGQTQLRARLQMPELNQLAQRIAVNCHLDPLDLHQTRQYIGFRLEAANGSKNMYTSKAVRLIHEHSGGIPRIINKICNAALIYGYGNNQKRIDHGIVESVLGDQICFTPPASIANGPNAVNPSATINAGTQPKAPSLNDSTDVKHINEAYREPLAFREDENGQERLSNVSSESEDATANQGANNRQRRRWSPVNASRKGGEWITGLYSATRSRLFAPFQGRKRHSNPHAKGATSIHVNNQEENTNNSGGNGDQHRSQANDWASSLPVPISYINTKIIRVHAETMRRNRLEAFFDDSPVAEYYRVLKTQILQSTREKGLNTLLVTSASGHEGKSLTAANLAISLAKELQHTVLLVDADLKRPSLHQLFDIHPPGSLSDALNGNNRLAGRLVNPGINKLTMLLNNQIFPNSAEIMSSPAMRDLIEEMKHRYADRYIIFDAPPVLGAADSLILSRYVDGVIMVTAHSETQGEDLYKAMDLLKEVNVLGTVLNKAPLRYHL